MTDVLWMPNEEDIKKTYISNLQNKINKILRKGLFRANPRNINTPKYDKKITKKNDTLPNNV